MNRPFRVHPSWRFICVGLLALVATVRAQTAAPDGAANVAAVSFYSPRTVLWLGRTAVLPFRSARASGEDSTLPASMFDPSVAEIIRPPTLLAGETTGYLRLRALRPGRTRLTLQGNSTIDLEVKPDPAGAAFAEIDAESSRPSIVSPMPDAAVWGQFSVGVEVFDAVELPATPVAPAVPLAGETSPPNPPVASANDGPTVRLRLPNGRLLDPVSRTGPEYGPVRHYQFDVQASELPDGPLRLVAVSTPAGFTEVDRRAGRGASLESQPLVLRNVRNLRTDAVLSGECEDQALIGPTKDLYAPARPPRYGTRQPDVVKDAAASGGQAMACGNAWCLPVVIKEPGDYQFFIQARGDYAAGAFASVGLYLENTEAPIGTVRLTGAKYQRLPVGGVVRLEAGPQVLTVAFKNGFGRGKENRNLFLDRFELAHLAELPAAATAAGQMLAAPNVPMVPLVAPGDLRMASLSLPAATALPRLNVLYPANGASAYGVDAVVGRATGFGSAGERPAWVDVLIDGEPQGVRLPSPAPTEPMVFPLLLRQMPAGRHRLSLRAADLGGHIVDSVAQTINVLADPPFTRGPYERAVYLLDRMAFGAESRELAAVLTMGETAWLSQRLTTGFNTPSEQALLHIATRHYPRVDDQNATCCRALNQWIASDNPVRSRFTAWVENHFSTWINKTEPASEWYSHLNFCRLGVAPFSDLLSVSAHSPAMIVYLDQAKSYANTINENYAREIMELHTLGVHGGYSQTDVTALAGVFNGWTVMREATLPQIDGTLPMVHNMGNDAGMINEFRFAPVLSDGKGQRVFGMEFPPAAPAARYDRVRLAMEMLASHPSTAEHVCRKLAEHYVGDPAPDGLVRQMAGAYLETGGDLGTVIRAMVANPAFWSAPPKMATPFDYGMRIARLCRTAVVQMGGDPDQSPKPEQVEAFLKKSGMGMFDRVTPDGYPQSDDAYADSNALLQRWHFMEEQTDALNRLVPKGWRTTSAPAPQPTSNDPGKPPAAPASDAQRFIDLVATRLTGRLLTAASNQAALDILGTDPKPEQYSQTLLFVSLLPETSLR